MRWLLPVLALAGCGRLGFGDGDDDGVGGPKLRRIDSASGQDSSALNIPRSPDTLAGDLVIVIVAGSNDTVDLTSMPGNLTLLTDFAADFCTLADYHAWF